MENRTDTVWQGSTVVSRYLEGVRGILPLAAEQIEVMMRVVQAGNPSVDRFLDLGCGDGILGAAILETYPAARGVLFDFSEPMIDAARQKLGHLAHQLDFVVGDYADSQWIEQVKHQAPFEAIVSGYSIHHQPDTRKQALYAELYNLLKPGGTFVNVEHVAAPSRWVERLWHTSLVDGMYNHYRQQGFAKTWDDVDLEFQESPENEANILALVETQCDWLRHIGFVDVDIYFKIFGLSVFGGRRP